MVKKKRKLTTPTAAKAAPAAAPAAACDEEQTKEQSLYEDEQPLEPPVADDPLLHEPSEEIAAIKEEEAVAGEDDPPTGGDPSSQDLDNGSAAPPPGDRDEDVVDGEDRDPESIQKLLDAFSKDQLAELLRDAAAAHPDVLARVYRLADSEPAHRKIFVHGLGWEATGELLVSAFQEYGEIEDFKAVTDKASGRCKGYGFILFKHLSGACRALKEPQKKIGSRMTACQLASIGPPVSPPPPPASEYTQRKIYVTNVAAELDPLKLLQFFSMFGEIEEGPLGLDKATGKPKGFCLFVYKSIESAKKALEEPHKKLEGHVLHCQRAIDGPKIPKQTFGFQHGGSNQGPHYARMESAKFVGGPGGGHLMAPSAAAGLNPAVGQALTAILAAQGTGLGGLANVLGSLGSAGGLGGPVMHQGGVQAPMVNAYGNQVGPVVPGSMPGGYGGAPMGQGGAGRSGHMGGYMGQ